MQLGDLVTLLGGLWLAAADGFAPNLVFYGPGEVLPSGTPGDPAAEYNKRAARSCGTLTSGVYNKALPFSTRDPRCQPVARRGTSGASFL